MKTIFLLSLLSISLVLHAQWKSTKGPYGGYIYDYKIEDHTIYICASNGLYRSDDDAKNWKHLNNNLPEYHFVRGFCVDKDELFLSFYNAAKNEKGFAYSNDKGEHWIIRPLPYPDWYSQELTYKDGILLARANKELIESYDKGISWVASNLGARSKGPDFIRSNNSYFFVSSYYGDLYRRAIQDTSWEKIYTSSVNYSDFHITDSLFIILNDGKSGLRSVDNGLNWKPIAIEGYNGTRKIADFGDSLYYSDFKYIYKSTDKGYTWRIIKNAPTRDLYFWDLMPAGKSLIGLIHFLGIVRTENEFATYETSAKGIYGGTSIKLIVTDSFLFVLSTQSVEKYNLFTKTWNNKSLLIGELLQDFFYFNGRLFVTSLFEEHLFISDNNGESFTKLNIPIGGGSGFSSKIIEFKNKLIIDVIGGYLISEDNGDSWTDFDFKQLPSGEPYSTNAMVTFNQKFIVADYDVNSKKSIYYISDDLSNLNLFPVNYPANNADDYFGGFFTVKDQLFIALGTSLKGYYLFKYDPSTFSLIETKGIPDLSSSIYDPPVRILENNGSMILNFREGYFKSDDGGLNWTKIIDDLNTGSYYFFRDLAMKDQVIYAATLDFGVLETRWDDLNTIVKTKNLNSVSNQLIIVYPNPSSGNFELCGEYLENRKTEVVRICNLQEKCVLEFNDKLYPSYKMNLESLNSGLYFLKIGNSDKMICKLLIQK